jgi:nucleoside-diphosphate-sugar epimerase
MKQGAMSETGEIPLSEGDINAFLGKPCDGVLETLRQLEGDVMILGAAGKMGATTASMLRQGFDKLGKSNRVLGVSRFSTAESRLAVEAAGAETIACDLIDRDAVQKLPDCPNVLFLAGQKFGSSSAPELAWAMNTIVPGYVAERFARSRIVVFSTGCVYPFVPTDSGGSKEEDPIEPSGDYANSCVGRERVFTYFSKKNGTPVAIYRLNYSIDLRYGVLVDVAQKVRNGEPVDVSTGYVNVIWQGDAVSRAIRLLDHANTPPFILNVTGPETISVRWLAEQFGAIFNRPARIVGEEEPTAWLSDASRSVKLLGNPSVDVHTMIRWIAAYLTDGGELLGKPTHFEARNGKF